MFDFFFFNNERMTATNLACYVLQRAKNAGIRMTNLKLQKILYYVQGYYLAKFDHPLFPDTVEAWCFGPVVPNAYFDFSINGPYEIEFWSFGEKDDMWEAMPQEEMELIAQVIDKKMRLPASELIGATRSEIPWLLAAENGTTWNSRPEITQDSMKEYFKKRLLRGVS